jgi:hypothetical protein
MSSSRHFPLSTASGKMGKEPPHHHLQAESPVASEASAIAAKGADYVVDQYLSLEMQSVRDSSHTSAVTQHGDQAEDHEHEHHIPF